MPLQCEFFALEGLSQLLSTVEQVKRSLNPGLTIHGVILTMFDARNNLAGQVVADVRAFLGDKVYETVIPRNVRVSEAPVLWKAGVALRSEMLGIAGLFEVGLRSHSARKKSSGGLIAACGWLLTLSGFELAFPIAIRATISD